MKTIKSLLAASLLAATAHSANAGILDGVSILNLTGVAESSLDAGNMSIARSTLVDEGASITDLSIGAFSAGSLAGIDILYVGLVNDGFSDDQLGVITSFVGSGGGLVFVGTERACCFGPSWEEIGNSFGLVGLGGDREAKASPTTPSSPIVDGAFGKAETYAPAATGAFNGALLPTGSTVVWEGVDGNPIIVTLDVTGRAFSFADTNFMQDAYINGGDNRTIWGNAFAFTGRVDPPPPGDVPEPAALALFGLGVLGLGAARRRRKA